MKRVFVLCYEKYIFLLKALLFDTAELIVALGSQSYCITYVKEIDISI